MFLPVQLSSGPRPLTLRSMVTMIHMGRTPKKTIRPGGTTYSHGPIEIGVRRFCENLVVQTNTKTMVGLI